jgi:hypothetical protein
LSGWPHLDLVTILIFLSAKNIIDNFIIWTDLNHESSRKLSQLSREKILRSFGLLELEIWTEHETVSGLQDWFGLLCCCYNLDLKTAFLNLGLHMKVLGLCLSFPSIYEDLNPRSTAPDMTQWPNSVPVWIEPASLF